jgi:SAM-dependent methyltransferase
MFKRDRKKVDRGNPQASSRSGSEYNRLVERLLGSMSHDEVMALGIGGNYIPFGILQRNILMQNGLEPYGYLVDIGCGSGRTAFALRSFSGLKYLGTDVVRSFLSHAERVCERRDWKFVQATGLTIPEQSDVVDMVCAFSLFTHLLHEETFVYLADVFRVLRPGGYLIFSFLDFAVHAHWAVFETNIQNIGKPGHLNQFIDAGAIRVWANHLGFEVTALRGGDEDYVELDEPLTLDDGRILTGRASLGQSLAILRKPC